MDKCRMVPIGQVLKSNGTDGQVLIGLKGIGTEDISEKEPVFIEFDGLPVPFFLSDISVRSSERFLAHLTDIDSLEDAEEVTGKKLYWPSEAFEDEDYQDFTGWSLLNGDQKVGEILGIEDIPGNPCLEISLPDDGTALVPLHEDLVLDIDEDKKLLSMSIPEGLL